MKTLAEIGNDLPTGGLADPGAASPGSMSSWGQHSRPLPRPAKQVRTMFETATPFFRIGRCCTVAMSRNYANAGVL